MNNYEEDIPDWDDVEDDLINLERQRLASEQPELMKFFDYMEDVTSKLEKIGFTLPKDAKFPLTVEGANKLIGLVKAFLMSKGYPYPSKFKWSWTEKEYALPREIEESIDSYEIKESLKTAIEHKDNLMVPSAINLRKLADAWEENNRLRKQFEAEKLSAMELRREKNRVPAWKYNKEHFNEGSRAILEMLTRKPLKQ